jgi:hypothetical protein
MSVTLLTGEKKIRDIITSLLLSERAPPDWDLYPELVTMVDRRGTSAEMPGRQPHPHPGTFLLCKGNHWRSKCSCLQMEGEVPPPMD